MSENGGGNFGSTGSNGSALLPSSQNSQNSHGSHPILRAGGDYQTLLSYQKSEVIYEITYRFCQRFLFRGDRTIDQMVQAARSGKQNILEGSKAATTSKETEIKLTNVARASFEELLEDYRNFLRVRDLAAWDKQSREAQYVRNLGLARPLTFAVFREFVETRPAGVVANIAICLIHQANYLIDHQLSGLEKGRWASGTHDSRPPAGEKPARRQSVSGGNTPGNNGRTGRTGTNAPPIAPRSPMAPRTPTSPAGRPVPRLAMAHKRIYSSVTGKPKTHVRHCGGRICHGRNG